MRTSLTGVPSTSLQLAQIKASVCLPQHRLLQREHMNPNLDLACRRDGNLTRLSSKIQPSFLPAMAAI
jgi:hypothetical protein